MIAVLLASTVWAAEVPETHFGFYEQGNRCAYPQRMPDFWRDQVADGFTTATISHNCSGDFMPEPDDPWYLLGFDGIHVFGTGGVEALHAMPHPCGGIEGKGSERVAGFARQMDAMLEAGIIRPEVPILCYSISAHDLQESQYFATRPWPEVLVGVVDEPDPENNPEQADLTIQQVRTAHAEGLRAITSIVGYRLLQPWQSKVTGKEERLIDWLDVAIVLSSTWGDTITGMAREAGCELWAYECIDHARSFPNYDRYMAGLWAWRSKPPCLLRWAYTHDAGTKVLRDGTVVWAKDDSYSFVVPTRKGPPLKTPEYLAYVEGIQDCHLLTRVERECKSPEAKQWLWRLRASIPGSCARPYNMPNGAPDPKQGRLPRDDFDAIRKQAKAFLDRER